MVVGPRSSEPGTVEPMEDVSWLAVEVRLPADEMGPGAAFWASVTGYAMTPSALGGAIELVPEEGDPFITFEPTDREDGVLEIEIGLDSPAAREALRRRALDLGATACAWRTVPAVRTPGGAIIRPTHVPMGRRRPPPYTPTVTADGVVSTADLAEGASSRLDQVCIDVPADLFDRELSFWSGLTGWEVATGGLSEFAWLVRPEWLPLRLLFQRLGPDDPGTTVRAHLDLACGDHIATHLEVHRRLGARPGRRGRVWHTMTDPAGVVYCLTERDPITGVIERSL